MNSEDNIIQNQLILFRFKSDGNEQDGDGEEDSPNVFLSYSEVIAKFRSSLGPPFVCIISEEKSKSSDASALTYSKIHRNKKMLP